MVVGGQDRAEAEEALEDGEEEEEEDTTTALVKFTIRGYAQRNRDTPLSFYKCLNGVTTYLKTLNPQ